MSIFILCRSPYFFFLSFSTRAGFVVVVGAAVYFFAFVCILSFDNQIFALSLSPGPFKQPNCWFSLFEPCQLLKHIYIGSTRKINAANDKVFRMRRIHNLVWKSSFGRFFSTLFPFPLVRSFVFLFVCCFYCFFWFPLPSEQCKRSWWTWSFLNHSFFGQQFFKLLFRTLLLFLPKVFSFEISFKFGKLYQIVPIK